MSQFQQILSTIHSNGTLELAMTATDMPTPKAHEVVVRIDAAPINPSDMWPLFGPANLAEAQYDADRHCLTAPIAQAHMPMVQARLDQTLPVGNEGAGVVVAAGADAQELMGKLVSIMPRASFAQYACVPALTCLAHKEGTSAADAASAFVNPLTALAFLETMRQEGHHAIIHTAAASNLGQMLVRLCQTDQVPLVNIVRNPAQVDILKALGAEHVVDSSRESWLADLEAAIDATGATLGFDATGGGQLASDILTVMERVASKDVKGLNTYGSSVHKQVYLYGALDTSPTRLVRSYGMSWGVGGWLMPIQLERFGPEIALSMRERVAHEITGIFASQYTRHLSLTDMLDPEIARAYVAKKTGEKFLVTPNA